MLNVGSLDGTSDYLAGIKAADPFRVEIVRAGDDAGIPTACDAGIARSKGRYIALLSNDAIVTPGWLDQLVALVSHSPTIGVVGPMSNHARPPQRVVEIPYRLHPVRPPLTFPAPTFDDPIIAEEPINAFAELWRREHRSKWFYVESLDPFCLLFKREVLDRIGALDRMNDKAATGSKPRFFDQDLLGSRVRQAGFLLACCHDLFVHHFGSRTPIVARANANRPP